MKISIVTVCYNSDKTIEETFKSVKEQTFNNIEYIVIDGNSTDNTISIIKKYSNIISYWKSEKDQGLYDAINKGISIATGDYVGILNSDDTFYRPSTIAEIASFLIKNPNVDAIVGDIVQHNGRKIIRKYSSINWTPEKLKNGFMPPHPSMFIKTELFRKFGNYTLGYKIAADYELIIRYFLKNNIDYKYSGIITTSMAVGGASSSGLKSYNIITEEISKAFDQNNIKYSPVKVRFRFIWKILGFINRN